MAQSNSDVSEILSWVNGVLISDLTQERFVTLLFVRLDVSKRSLAYASAGHVPGYILDGNGGIKTVLGATGIPLGLFGDRRCAASGEIVLDPGDIIILLTDGITESLEPQESDLALERSLDFVRTHRHESAAAIVKGLLAAVRDWTPAGPQADDMTAIICKVGP
jgi:sigma-B regulation protein RsbU (phosphoserine phosphatase)